MGDRKIWRNSLVWLVIAVVLFTVWMTLLRGGDSNVPEIPISQVLQDVSQNKVARI
ncbi:MAG: ATP-dependent metallopeptidase FtsH/Yme1/Tma family protein, partial [Chloroflexia bacterium]